MLRVFAAVLVLVSAVSPVDAQRGAREPRRPRLTAGADTNDANAYLQFGQRTIETNAGAAADAFYWASRLDPSSADAYYGRRTATLMRRASTFKGYMEGVRRTVFSDEMRANDSLYFHALQLDPFLHARFERILIQQYFRTAIGDGINAGQIDFYVERQLQAAPPGVQAGYEAASGRFVLALDLYTTALRSERAPTRYYIERARVNALQGLAAEAIVDYQTALQKMRAQDARTDTVVIFYSSKALHEYSIALLHARRNAIDSARAALGRALEEDLAFYPAHVELAQLALRARDTTTAMSEMSIAAELAPASGHAQFQYGDFLVSVGRFADAIPVLRKAIELEPYYANAYRSLGTALDRTGDAAGAREAYGKFLAAAARNHPQRAAVQSRLGALGGGN